MDIQTETQRAIIDELGEQVIRYARTLAAKKRQRLNAVGIPSVAINIAIVSLPHVEYDPAAILNPASFDSNSK